MTISSMSSPRGPAALREFVHRASDVPLPDPRDARTLVLSAQGGDDSAARLLIQSHLRFVVDEAIRARGPGHRVEQLVPVGIEALLDAVRSCPGKEVDDFSPFARERIREALKRRVLN